jgi:hypothetical protein
MYDHFAVVVAIDRLWEFFVSRGGSDRVQDGCVHERFPLSPRILAQVMPTPALRSII